MDKQYSLIFSALLVLVLTTGCNKHSSTQMPGPSGGADFSHREKEQINDALNQAAIAAQGNGTKVKIPSLTFLIKPQSVNSARKAILAAGGKVEYDPNDGQGEEIPFLVATVSAESLLNAEFVKGLQAEAIKLNQNVQIPLVAANVVEAPGKLRGIPTDEIGLADVANQDGAKSAIVGIIDTGIDVTHPALKGRVIGVYDATEVGDIPLTSMNAKDVGFTSLKLEGIPEGVEQVFPGVIDEVVLGSQQPEASRGQGVNINDNGSNVDKIPFVVFKDTSGKFVVRFDKDGDGKLDADVVEDYNTNPASLLRFNKRFAYPVTITLKDDVPEKLTIFYDNLAHGTHVAGIVGGNLSTAGMDIKGPAYNTKFLAAKVCSEWSCTDASILRALVGIHTRFSVKPDVVNMSIGSLEREDERFYAELFRDLAGRYGTTFVLSAGNSGPGHRTLNSLATNSPTILVGAYASERMMQELYPGSTKVPADMMFSFTSVGPSITGEFKPHVVAPGAALASTPITEKGVAVFQGTSMSAPMVTGAIAVMISKARQEGWFDELKSQEKSLVQIPLIIRRALEDSARKLPDISPLRQGHGLINVPGALNRFRELRDSISVEFELEKKETGMIYGRSGENARSQNVVLSVPHDRRRSVVEEADLYGSFVTIRLKSITKESPDGGLEDLTKSSVMGLGLAGEDKPVNSINVLLAAATKNQFSLLRSLDRMKDPGNYFAIYDVERDGERLYSFVDAIYRPIDLQEVKVSVDGAKGTVLTKKTFSVMNQSLDFTQVHRYFVQVSKADRILEVELTSAGIGRTVVDIYNPNGENIGNGFVSTSPLLPTDKKVETLRGKTNGLAGIYEVVVGENSVYWASKNSYHLTISTKRIGVSAVTTDGSGIIVLNNPDSIEGAQLASDRWVKVKPLGDTQALPGEIKGVQFQAPASGYFVVRARLSGAISGRIVDKLKDLNTGSFVEQMGALATSPVFRMFPLERGHVYEVGYETFSMGLGIDPTVTFELLEDTGVAVQYAKFPGSTIETLILKVKAPTVPEGENWEGNVKALLGSDVLNQVTFLANSTGVRPRE